MAVVFVDPSAHRDALAWYGLRRAEPAGASALAIGAVISVPHYSLDSLLDQMEASVPPGGDAIIVGHGRDQGLAARLLPGSEGRFRHEIANALAADTATPSEFGPLPAIAASQVATMARITPAQVAALRVKMNRIRAKHMGHVAFRACNMGAWPDTLSAYARFFRARAVSAPNLRDTYGTFPLGGATADINAWAASRTGAGRPWHVFVYGASPNRVAVATRGGESDEHSYEIEAAAESEAALTAWRAQQLTAGGFGSVLYHGCFRRTPLAGSQRVTFVGDAEYARHIVTQTA